MNVGLNTTLNRNTSGLRACAVAGSVLIGCLFHGCTALDEHGQQSVSPPLRVVVGPVVLEEPIPKSSQIYSFSDDPTAEMEPIIASQLVDDIQVKAQLFLTTHLSQQSGMVVVPFDESRRFLGDIAPGGTALNAEQAGTLASLTGADVVITGLIHDYGRVRWQYLDNGLAHACRSSLNGGRVCHGLESCSDRYLSCRRCDHGFSALVWRSVDIWMGIPTRACAC